MIKKCSKCGFIKQIGEFHKNKQQKDGHHVYCKLCVKIYHGEHSQELSRKAREWNTGHPVKAKDYADRYYEVNKERIIQMARKRRIANPYKNREEKAKRRALEHGAGSERISNAIVFLRDGGKCHICGEFVNPLSWHLDHIVPLSRGGKHCYENVAVSHPVCNLRKGNR